MVYTSVSQTFLLAGPFWIKKKHRSSPSFSRKDRVSGRLVSKIKNLFLRTDFRWLRIYANSIRNNALYDLTLINLIVACFTGTGDFLISHFVVRSKHTANYLNSAIIFSKKKILWLKTSKRQSIRYKNVSTNPLGTGRSSLGSNTLGTTGGVGRREEFRCFPQLLQKNSETVGYIRWTINHDRPLQDPYAVTIHGQFLCLSSATRW
jgi:hypothetical protein